MTSPRKEVPSSILIKCLVTAFPHTNLDFLHTNLDFPHTNLDFPHTNLDFLHTN